MSKTRVILLAGTMLAASLTAAGAWAAESPASAATEVGEVVVTGTRLKLPADYTAPNPVMSVSAQKLESRGVVNLTDYLRNIPALTNSLKSEDYANAADRSSVGLNELNLRNLGTQRTLVLVNGLRHVSGDQYSQAVDINSIPEALIDRVEVLTGGVSAIYGADAVSGVVNFVMKDRFEGVDVRAQAGAATEGAGQSYQGSLLVGHNFVDSRGNFTFAFQGQNVRGVGILDRDYLRPENDYSLVNNPDPNGKYTRVFARDVRYHDSAEGGAVYTNLYTATTLAGVSFQGNGDPWVDGVDVGSDFMIGGSGTLGAKYREQVLPPSQRYVLNGTFNFDVTPKLRFFAEGKWARSQTTFVSQPSFNYGIFVPIDNPYIPASIVAGATTPGGLGAQAGVDATCQDFGICLPGPGVLVGRDNFDLGDVFEDITRNTYRFVGGFKGSPTDWLDFQAAYVYGRTETHDVERNNRIEERFYAATDVVLDPSTGKPTCRSNLDPSAVPFGDPFLGEAPIPDYPATFTPGPNSGCVPINIFGPNISKAGAKWINQTTVQDGLIEQHDVSAYISGRSTPLFELPAGPVSFVLGTEFRSESSVYHASPIQKQAAADQFNISFLGQASDSAGSYTVYEFYGEANVPLLKDVFLAKRLSLGGAYRFSNYSTAGSTNTYKVNLEWEPIDSVLLRGTYAHAVRAPNITELFQPTVQTYALITDPCDKDNYNIGKAPRIANCIAAVGDPADFVNTTSDAIAGTIGGNRDVKPETSDSYTYGIVWTPRFIPNLYISIDYYNIKLDQAIETFDAQVIADKCVDLPQPNQFCDDIRRDPVTHQIDGFTQKYLNIAGYRTSGIDFSVRYRVYPKTFGIDRDIGYLDLDLQGNKLEELTFIEDPTAGPDKQIGVANSTVEAPVWQLNLDAAWHVHNFTINYGYNYSSPMRRISKEAQRADPLYVAPQYFFFSARSTHDIQVRYDLEHHWSFYVGCNNFTDQRPDIGDPQPSEPVSPLGRFVYVGLEAKF
jgi:outer membrane receptor protein involved in Fe transport